MHYAMRLCHENTVQLNLNLHTHAGTHTYVLACLMCAKLQEVTCACTVACVFGMHTQDIEYSQHMRNACHKLALALPHYMCGVTTRT